MRRRHGRWVSRHAFVDYLEGCATELGVRTAVETLRLDRQGEVWRCAAPGSGPTG